MLNKMGSTWIKLPYFISWGNEPKVSAGNGTSTTKLPLVGWDAVVRLNFLCVHVTSAPTYHVPLSVGSRSPGCSVLASVRVKATPLRSATPTSMSSSIPTSSPVTSKSTPQRHITVCVILYFHQQPLGGFSFCIAVARSVELLLVCFLHVAQRQQINFYHKTSASVLKSIFFLWNLL